MLVLDLGELNVDTEKPPSQALLTTPVNNIIFNFMWLHNHH